MIFFLSILHYFWIFNVSCTLLTRKTCSNLTFFRYFLTNLLPSLNQISEFTSLSLDDIENLNFNELYRVLPKTVKSLSVVNCNLSIDQVFNTLNCDSKNGNNGLSVLNLSYNTFSNRPKTSISDIIS